MKASRSNHAMRDVLTFLFRHWRREAWLVAGVAAAMLAATVADLFMPLFAGRLVDAVSMHATHAQQPLHEERSGNRQSPHGAARPNRPCGRTTSTISIGRNRTT